MNCITPWCNSTIINTWHAPDGYSLTTYKGEPLHHCPSCGAKWRDTDNPIFPREAKMKKLEEVYADVKAYRARSGDIDVHSVGGSNRAGRREP